MSIQEQASVYLSKGGKVTQCPPKAAHGWTLRGLTGSGLDPVQMRQVFRSARSAWGG